MNQDEYNLTEAGQRLDALAATVIQMKNPHKYVKATESQKNGNEMKAQMCKNLIQCDDTIKQTQAELDLIYIKYRDIETEMLRADNASSQQQWDEYKLVEELMDFALNIIVTCKDLIKEYKRLMSL